MWTAIFQIPKSYKNIANFDGRSEIPIASNLSLRMKNVMDAVCMHNEYEKLMQGVFENYLHFRVAGVEGAIEILNWFSFNDKLLYQINKEQTYGTYMYLPFAFASWHLSLSSLSWPKINYPNKSYEITQKLNATKSLMETLMKGLSSSVRGIGTTPTCIHLNSLFYVRYIISPTLRSVSSQLLRSDERLVFEQTVQIMVDMGLSYMQLRTFDGTQQLNLDPNIDYLFQLVENSVPSLNTWSKQLIAREIELAKIQRNKVKTNTPCTAKKSSEKKKNNDEKQGESRLPNFMVRLQCKALPATEKLADSVRKDFFGRFEKILESEVKGKNQVMQSIIKGSIWYSFKEGFNNAVRKNLSVSDFM